MTPDMHPVRSRILLSRGEAGRMARLALPVFFGQMSQMLMGVVDTVMTGRYHTTDMAAVALAASLWLPVSLCGVGVVLALTPLTAQRMGAGKRADVPHLLRQGILLALLLSVPLAALLFFIAGNVHWFGIEGRAAEVCAGWLRAVTCGLPGLLLYIAVRGLTDGDSRTRPSMIIAFGGLLLNVPCNYILIYGCFGLPELGGTGSGIATALISWCMSAALICYTRKATSYRDLQPLYAPLWRAAEQTGAEKAPARFCLRPPRPDFALMLRILRIGLPGALAMLFEVSCFAVTALLLAPLGMTVVAGHQVAMNFSGVLFMLPLSLGMTCTIRVGHLLGESRPAAAQIAIWTALAAGLCLTCAAGAGTALFRHEIAAFYSADPEVRALAAHLLLYAAAFQTVDGIQAISVGALRGYNDTRFISFATFTGYWCLGLPAGFVLARTDLLTPAMGAAGFWAGFVLSLIIMACVLQLRLRTLRRLGPRAAHAFISR